MYLNRFSRYDLWLRGEDVGPHPEDPRLSAAPPPTNIDLVYSDPDKAPEEYDQMVPKNKRHTIHKKKNSSKKKAKGDLDATLDSPDIPADVKKVLEDLEAEENEMEHPCDQPDEQQLEVLEDIWLKAGEMGNKIRSQ